MSIPAPSEFADRVSAVLDEIGQLLIVKNTAYGDSALDPVRVFSRLTVEDALMVRVDDKLSRIARGSEFPGEDTLTDLIGYLVLLKIARGERDE